MNHYNTNKDSRWKDSASSDDDDKPMSNPPINPMPNHSSQNQTYRQGNNQRQQSSYNYASFRQPSNSTNYTDNRNQYNVSNSDNFRTQQNNYNYGNNKNQQYSQNYNYRNQQSSYNQDNSTNQTNSYNYNNTQNQQNSYNYGNNRNQQYSQNYNYRNQQTSYNYANNANNANQQNSQNYGNNINFARNYAAENERTQLPRFSQPNMNFPRNNTNQSEVIFLNDGNKTNTSNANFQRSNQSYIDENVAYQPYLGLIFNEMKFSDEMNLDNIEIDTKPTPVSVRYTELNSELKNLLNEEFKTHISSIEYGSVFPFGSIIFKPLCLKITSMPNYSHEEIRLAYYISRGNSDLANKYEKIMDKCQLHASRILENLKSCDLEKFTTSYEKMYWPKRSDELNVILSRYTDKINNIKKVVESIVEDAQIRTLEKPKKNINPWHNSPILSLPINHQVQLNSPLLEKPKPSDFPTIANKIPYCYFLNHLIYTPTGPNYLQPNSRSSIFDGAYSYHETVSGDKSYSCESFNRFSLPLQPPSRIMCI